MGGICNNNDRDTYYNTHFIKSKLNYVHNNNKTLPLERGGPCEGD